MLSRLWRGWWAWFRSEHSIAVSIGWMKDDVLKRRSYYHSWFGTTRRAWYHGNKAKVRMVDYYLIRKSNSFQIIWVPSSEIDCVRVHHSSLHNYELDSAPLLHKLYARTIRAMINLAQPCISRHLRRIGASILVDPKANWAPEDEDARANLPPESSCHRTCLFYLCLPLRTYPQIRIVVPTSRLRACSTRCSERGQDRIDALSIPSTKASWEVRNLHRHAHDRMAMSMPRWGTKP